MRKIVECVPNFSEGRNPETIQAIADAIKATPGCTLLDVDPGKSTNRTVMTFVGSPSAVVEGALNSARVARKLINMTQHSGAHPRIGAMDVCPFVPVANVTMDECIECAHEFARKASAELDIPLYLYESASTREYRKSLPQIREGDYEALAARIVQPDWKPDYGPAAFVPEWGATVTGARFFLIAYNINLLGTRQQAHRIALNIREAGRGNGERGRFTDVKAIGWEVDEYNVAQISVNLTNYKESAPHVVFEECVTEAKKLGVAVAGSELVGVLPLEAVLMAADYYIQKENLLVLDQAQKIRLAVERLGLNSISPFDPKKKIIEFMIGEDRHEPLAQMSVRAFIQSLAARTSAPGGGSAAAAIAAMGAGLSNMVAWLTYGVRKFEAVEPHMRKALPVLYGATQELISMIDADTNAFKDFVDAGRMPKATETEQRARHLAMQAGLKKAIEVPFKTMRLAQSCWDALLEVARYGNIHSKSDLEVGARALEVGIWGAYRNVLINMVDIEDLKFKKQMLEDAESMVKHSQSKCQEILDLLASRTV